MVDSALHDLPEMHVVGWSMWIIGVLGIGSGYANILLSQLKKKQNVGFGLAMYVLPVYVIGAVLAGWTTEGRLEEHRFKDAGEHHDFFKVVSAAGGLSGALLASPAWVFSLPSGYSTAVTLETKIWFRISRLILYMVLLVLAAGVLSLDLGVLRIFLRDEWDVGPLLKATIEPFLVAVAVFVVCFFVDLWYYARRPFSIAGGTSQNNIGWMKACCNRCTRISSTATQDSASVRISPVASPQPTPVAPLQAPTAFDLTATSTDSTPETNSESRPPAPTSSIADPASVSGGGVGLSVSPPTTAGTTAGPSASSTGSNPGSTDSTPETKSASRPPAPTSSIAGPATVSGGGVGFPVSPPTTAGTTAGPSASSAGFNTGTAGESKDPSCCESCESLERRILALEYESAEARKDKGDGVTWVELMDKATDNGLGYLQEEPEVCACGFECGKSCCASSCFGHAGKCEGLLPVFLYTIFAVVGIVGPFGVLVLLRSRLDLCPEGKTRSLYVANMVFLGLLVVATSVMVFSKWVGLDGSKPQDTRTDRSLQHGNIFAGCGRERAAPVSSHYEVFVERYLEGQNVRFDRHRVQYSKATDLRFVHPGDVSVLFPDAALHHAAKAAGYIAEPISSQWRSKTHSMLLSFLRDTELNWTLSPPLPTTGDAVLCVGALRIPRQGYLALPIAFVTLFQREADPESQMIHAYARPDVRLGNVSLDSPLAQMIDRE